MEGSEHFQLNPSELGLLLGRTGGGHWTWDPPDGGDYTPPHFPNSDFQIHPEDEVLLEASLVATRRENTQLDLEIRVLTGEKKQFNLRLLGLTHPGGSVTGIYIDITEQKNREKTLSQVRQRQLACLSLFERRFGSDKTRIADALRKLAQISESPVTYFISSVVPSPGPSIMIYDSREKGHEPEAIFPGSRKIARLLNAEPWREAARTGQPVIDNQPGMAFPTDDLSVFPRAKKRQLVLPLPGDSQSPPMGLLGAMDKKENYTQKDIRQIQLFTNSLSLILTRQHQLKRIYEYKKYFDLSGEMMCIASPAGYYLKINSRFIRFLGYTRQEFLTTPIVDFVLPEDREKTAREIERLNQGMPSVRFRNRYRGKNGRIHWLDWTGVQDPSSGLIFATARDITEIMDTARKLKKSNQELREFAYIASHDLQEPLRVISNYMGLLERRLGSDLSPKNRDFLVRSRRAADRLKKMVSDLLDYSRTDRKNPNPVVVDQEHLIKVVLFNLEASIAETGAKIDWPPLPELYLDQQQAERVFQNLLGNALKFRHPDRIPKVEIRGWRTGDRVFVSVRDNGIGIAPDAAERVFKIFQKLHGREEYPGTGLGLAIVKKIVDNSGGKIRLESDGKSGTTFFLEFPAAPGSVFGPPAPPKHLENQPEQETP